jgi:hypothetical protein
MVQSMGAYLLLLGGRLAPTLPGLQTTTIPSTMGALLLVSPRCCNSIPCHRKKKDLLKEKCHEIFCFSFFHESPSPKPLKITLGSFRLFSKLRGDIRKSRCTTGVNDTGGKLPPVLTTPAANLPPVSTTPAANFATSSACVNDAGGKLPPVSTTQRCPNKIIKIFQLEDFYICHRFRKNSKWP